MIEPLLTTPVLAVAVMVTVPLPVPLVGDRVTQSRLSDAVQAQLELEAVTDTELVPPLEVKLPLVGEMVVAQAAVEVSATQRTDIPFWLNQQVFVPVVG